MSASASVTCPKCGSPVIFILPPRTMGGKSESCKKCANMVTIVFSTNVEGVITDIRLV